MLTIKQQTAASAIWAGVAHRAATASGWPGSWWTSLTRLMVGHRATAGNPLTAREIALALMDHKGLDTSDERN
jgi:hypothetical protein